MPRWRSKRWKRLSCRNSSRDLTDRRRIHQPALAPKSVLATRQLQVTALPKIALEHLAVIADGLDRVERPLVVQRHELTVVAGRAEQPLRIRCLAFKFLIDVGLRD